jgi:hypothetical protein
MIPRAPLACLGVASNQRRGNPGGRERATKGGLKMDATPIVDADVAVGEAEGRKFVVVTLYADPGRVAVETVALRPDLAGALADSLLEAAHLARE